MEQDQKVTSPHFALTVAFKSAVEAEAFVDYAADSEGMVFVQGNKDVGGKVVCRAQGDYDSAVVRAVVRNFREEWRAFVSE